MKQLRRLLPYYSPYLGQLVTGLVLVVISTAITSIIPWFLRLGIDAIRADEPFRRTLILAGDIVAVGIFAGFLRYGMREILNGISRRIEYDLRNDLFVHLERLDASYFGRTRTGDIMARLTNDLGAVRMVAGPAIMYLVNTIASGLFALVFMLRIDPMLTGLALLPMIALPIITVRMGSAMQRPSLWSSNRRS